VGVFPSLAVMCAQNTDIYVRETSRWKNGRVRQQQFRGVVEHDVIIMCNNRARQVRPVTGHTRASGKI